MLPVFSIVVASRKSNLQEEAKRIFEICVLHGISIKREWVPRFRNEQANYLSRTVDFDDWFDSPRIFRFLDLKWEPHSIDSFAARFSNAGFCTNLQGWCSRLPSASVW